MSRVAVHLVVILLGAAVVGCSSNAVRQVPEYHTVRAGETLYSIARSYGLDYRQLAQWNRLSDPSLIRVGQRLVLQPSGKAATRAPATANAPRAVPPDAVPPPPTWLWPTAGDVYLRYGQSPQAASGIRIAGAAGQPIQAAAAGEVVYAGSGLPSYGQLLIIKHNQSWLSAYGFNSALYAREGERVLAGQHVADMGEDAKGRAVLHFEIRVAGQPVDPLRYLPPR